MSGKVVISKDKLDNLANAIASKCGTGVELTIDEMEHAVNHLTLEPNLQSKNVKPKSSVQVVSPDSEYDGLSRVVVDAISGNYVGENVERRNSSDLTVSDATVSVPSGYYPSQASASVATSEHQSPTIVLDAHTGVVTATHSQTGGYVSTDVKTSTIQLETEGGATVTPSKTAQIAVEAGKYTLGNLIIDAIPSEYIVPDGTITIRQTGTTDVAQYAYANVDIVRNLQSKTVAPTSSTQVVSADSSFDGLSSVTITPATLQSKIVSPTEESQRIIADAGNYGLSDVTVNAIPSNYIGSEVPERSSSDLLAVGSTVTVPQGYYENQVSKSIPDGDVGVSGNASATISSITASYNQERDNFSLSGSSQISGVANAFVITEGYIGQELTASAQISGVSLVDASFPKIAGTTSVVGSPKVTPSISRTETSAQGAVNVGSGESSTTPPSSGYFVSVKSEADTNEMVAFPTISTSGYGTDVENGFSSAIIEVGANASEVTYIPVIGGSATIPNTTITVRPVITVDSDGSIHAVNSGSQSITPTVSQGYVVNGTNGTISVDGSASVQMDVIPSTTYNVSNVDRTISSGAYITGAQTIKGVSTTGITASNIKDGVNVLVGDSDNLGRIITTTGSFTDSSTVSSGQTAASESNILSGYSAWVDGEEVKGTIQSRVSSDISVSDDIVSVPPGYYSETSSVTIDSGTVTVPDTTISVTPSISIDSASGQITASVSGSQSISPSVSEGYVSSGTSGTVSVTGSRSYYLQTEASKTITPSDRTQVAVEAGKYTTGPITVAAIPNSYVPSGVPRRSSADMTLDDTESIVVVAPSGYYETDASYEIDLATASIGSLSINNANGLVTATLSVNKDGYIFSDSKSSTLQLETQPSATINPSTIPITAVSSGKFTTGNVVVSAIRLESKTITPTDAVQIVTPDENYDGFSEITVNPGASYTDAEGMWF